MNHIQNETFRNENEGDTIDMIPVVHFFGGNSCSWLFTEYDSENEIFFGLCYIGLEKPELGYVSRQELEEARFKPFNLPIERNMYFNPKKTLEKYHEESKITGNIAI